MDMRILTLLVLIMVSGCKTDSTHEVDPGKYTCTKKFTTQKMRFDTLTPEFKMIRIPGSQYTIYFTDEITGESTSLSNRNHNWVCTKD